ncbi:16S rRNA (cytosine(1402)-N(4))-methyltransferase RsmH [Patescibacteria group bacterium]|nr:16S rRNA (cytosine(1402)-N(4))-methyltransferase RsmH [Patescibacteria group bacterium]
MNFHKSVLLKETIDFLNIQKGKKYIDATLGGAGHSLAILKRGGRVLAIEWDSDALSFAKKRIEEEGYTAGKEIILAKGNFKDIKEIARLNDFLEVEGIIFDLGVSSYQLDRKDRGFSFLRDGPLDMRMSKDLSVKAADLLNVLSRKELYEIFYRFGEEHRARTVSDSIVRARRIKIFETTNDLVEVIKNAYGIRAKELSNKIKASISKRVFQGLRIAVNSELDNLKEAIPSSLEVVRHGGRIAIISFHSLEDRIVKQVFKEFSEKNKGKALTKRPIIPNIEEMESNRRGRSSKLRVFEKL